MTEGISLAILGLGPGGLAMLPYLDAHPDVRLAGLCDLRIDALQAAPVPKSVPRWTSIDDLLASDVEAVYVATPTHHHAAHAIAAMRAGKDVIIEKPMCVSLMEADAIASTAAQTGRKVVVGHSQSFEPAIQLMRALIVSGAVGQLRALNAWNATDWMYRARLPVEFQREAGGGVVHRQGVHHADMLRYLAGGSPRTLRAAIGDWDPLRPGDGSYSAFLSFDDGVVATLFYSGYDHFPATELTFGIGENGRQALPGHARARRALRAGGSDPSIKHGAGLAAQMERLAPGEHPACFGMLLASCTQADLRIDRTGVQVFADDFCRTLPIVGLPAGRSAVLDELVSAAAGVPTVHDAAWGRANMAMCHAIVESSLAATEVSLNSNLVPPTGAPALAPPPLVFAHLQALFDDSFRHP
ncbi:dehydrogenase [Pigmentiphaga litoralis]|uniref:Gfo/Idh/MocA family protein n=1 Tax=Pigmentiphaga litoralis TaxID=516702 RepID=UPI0016793A8B|nr:Gfo/Idh/MocA family oxidoreductase [Pigmentiphaga litoralis]GGX19209.1 dehydrogenase [Pigmentiphaga litoralis]